MRGAKYLIPLTCGILALASLSPAQASTYRVLAIRVDFPLEDPDHETTSGRGEFDLRDYYAPGNDDLRSQYFHPWDVPPHNRAYFDHHLQALDNYWSTVSEGRVSIDADILPRNPDGAYRMSNTFYKYGNGRTTEETYRKLVELLVEAVDACKDVEGDAVDFADYDTIMIIHAGIGSETSGQLNDIPSAYISRDDILKYHSSPFAQDGREIEHAIVVPEMTAANGVGGLNGIMAQMFGHRLGLPSMSNNDLGLPAAGGWCLMDTGAMSWGARTRGFVPTHPMAWSKIELGWIEPVTVTADTTISIAATHIAGDLPRAVKVPVTADEYFLIENRHNYAPRDSLASAVYSDSDSSGVWLRPDHYDAYIPGSGILVWLINDRIISEHRADGSINNDSFRRGIDLIEADGRQDIGALFGFGDPRAEYTEGHDEDTFRADGNDTFGPDTFPASESLWGGRSGITIKVHSDPGDTMSVSITFESGLAGFPAAVPGARELSAADLDGDGADELIVSNSDSAYAFTAGGTLIGSFPASAHPALAISPNAETSLFAVHDRVMTYYRLDGDSLETDWSVETGEAFFLSGNRILVNPEGIPWASVRNGDTGMLISPKDTRTATFPFADVAGISIIGEQFAATSNHSLHMGVLGDHGMTISLIDPSAPLMVDTDRDDDYETVVAIASDVRFYHADGVFESRSLDSPRVGSPVAADIDSDGYPEVMIAAGNKVYGYRSGAVPAQGFPFALPPGDNDEVITASPVIADLDGDGAPDIAVVTSNMRIVAWDTSGALTPGFPLTMTSSTTVSPVVFRTAGGHTAIAYVTDSGLIMAHDIGIPAIDEPQAWPMEGGGPGRSGSFPNSRIAAPVKRTASFEAICYPNPVTGGAGTFRITPQKSTDCRIEVFTADGRRVFETYVPASSLLPGVPNEIRMDASGLASGLYLARVKTNRETVILKIGVLK